SGPASRILIGPISVSVKTRPADSEGLVTWRTLACALWLRTNAISCVPGTLISAMNMPARGGALHPPCAVNWHQSSLRPARDRSCPERILSNVIVCDAAAVNRSVNCLGYPDLSAIPLSSLLTSPQYFFECGRLPVSS